jgi:Fuc2NAc and GlcNAc transferase
MLLYLVSIVLGGLGAQLVSRYGNRVGLSDLPNKRSSHHIPTPKGGGIGIFATFLAVSLVLHISPFFWVPIAAVSLIGLYGDRVDLSPKIRLLVQFAGALTLILGGRSFSQGWGLFLIPLWAIYIVGTANFYNFMDGINGIAGITGIIAFSLLAVFAYSTKMTMPLVILPACIFLSCAGFLPFNIPKAKAFIGDVGSYFLGFTFASFVFLFSKNFLDLICLASFLFPFYADELTTMAIRIRDGENLFNAHRRHLYQILVNERRFPHWSTAIAYGILQVLIGGTVLALRSHGIFAVLSFVLFCFFAFTLVSINLRERLETPKGRPWLSPS